MHPLERTAKDLSIHATALLSSLEAEIVLTLHDQYTH